MAHMHTQLARQFRALPGLSLFVLLPILWLEAEAAPAQNPASVQAAESQAVNRAGSATRGISLKGATSPRSANQLAWKDLSAEQRLSLEPLASRWDKMSGTRKQKWLLISKNYPNLPPEEQAKLHKHMSKWVNLSQRQRTQARMSFKGTKALSTEQKAAQWAAYQALSPEEKRKFAAKARSKPAGVATVKPVSSGKLTHISRHQRAKRIDAIGAEVRRPVQQNTLLPGRQPREVAQEPSHVGNEKTQE
jgi:hypothetical protein